MPFVLANIFQPLIDVFDSVIVFFHDQVGFGWGMSIIALTVTVRLVLVPLTVKQFRSMQEMQRLAPHIKELQQKYKDDKQRLNQEMMKLYQEHKVNPFGSCLPLVLQFPVFISLFYMLRKDLKVDICGPAARIAAVAHAHGTSFTNTHCETVQPGSAKFLFIPDLTAPAHGWVLGVLIVLYIGSQLLSSVLMSTTVDRNQRLIMIFLPFLFVTFIIRFPAGLIVYWVTTNLWTVGQQYLIRRSTGPLQPVAAGTPAGATAIANGGQKGASPTPRRAAKAEPEPEPAADNGAGSKAAPPPPPRRKRKRSGRRR
jgi:YidC/Oxa1 family membrane protein insertase